MSCNCFKTPKPGDIRFSDKVEKSKCTCSARFVVKENKKRFSIESIKDLARIDKIKIDDYFDCSKRNCKCDYLFIYKEEQKPISFIFVELKGVDVKHAVEQLEAAINLFYDNKYIAESKPVRGAIVASAIPKDNGTYRAAKRSAEKRIKNKIKDFRIEQKNWVMKYDPVSDTFS